MTIEEYEKQLAECDKHRLFHMVRLSSDCTTGSINTKNDMVIIPMPEIKNHFSTPICSAKRPEHNTPKGIANDITLPSKEKTLPKYSGLIFSWNRAFCTP